MVYVIFFALIFGLIYVLYSPSDRKVKAFISNTHKTGEKASLFAGLKALYTKISLLNRTNALEKFGVSKFNIFVFFHSNKLYFGFAACLILVVMHHLLIGIFAFVVFLFLPDIFISFREKKLYKEFLNDQPIVMEMIAIYIQAGNNFEKAASLVIKDIAPINKSWLYQMNLLVQNTRLFGLKEAMELFGKSFIDSDSITKFAYSMIAAFDNGTPIVDMLLTDAEDLRELIYLNMEERMSSLPTKLSVPMILFFLVPIPIIILVPQFMMYLKPALAGYMPLH